MKYSKFRIGSVYSIDLFMLSSPMDMLNRHVSIGVMLRAVPLSIFAEIPSGPLALSVIYGFKVGWYLVIRWILITC